MYSRCLLLSLPAAPLTFAPHNKRAPLNALYGVKVGVLESCHLIGSEDFAIPQSHRHLSSPRNLTFNTTLFTSTHICEASNSGYIFLESAGFDDSVWNFNTCFFFHEISLSTNNHQSRNIDNIFSTDKLLF